MVGFLDMRVSLAPTHVSPSVGPSFDTFLSASLVALCNGMNGKEYVLPIVELQNCGVGEVLRFIDGKKKRAMPRCQTQRLGGRWDSRFIFSQKLTTNINRYLALETHIF